MKVKRVSAPTLQSAFNKSQYPQMIEDGALTAVYLSNRLLPEPRPFQGPKGTRSQTIRYVDSTGEWLVEIHQYLRPDGTLGASGKQDPKRMKINGLILMLEQ